jgi:hypothetical protein
MRAIYIQYIQITPPPCRSLPLLALSFPSSAPAPAITPPPFSSPLLPPSPAPHGGGDLPAVPPIDVFAYSVTPDDHQAHLQKEFAAGPAPPSAPSRPPLVDPPSPPCAWPPSPPAPHARRPSAPAPAWRRAGARPARGGTDRASGGGAVPRAAPPKGGVSRRAQLQASSLCCCCLLLVVLFQASGCWLLPSVVLCVGVFLLLLCHAAFLFLSLSLLFCFVLCLCFCVSAAVAFCRSCADDGRPRPRGIGRRCVAGTDFDAHDGILSTYYVQYIPASPATCRAIAPQRSLPHCGAVPVGTDFVACDGEFCPFLRHSPVHLLACLVRRAPPRGGSFLPRDAVFARTWIFTCVFAVNSVVFCAVRPKRHSPVP